MQMQMFGGSQPSEPLSDALAEVDTIADLEALRPLNVVTSTIFIPGSRVMYRTRTIFDSKGKPVDDTIFDSKGNPVDEG